MIIRSETRTGLINKNQNKGKSQKEQTDNVSSGNLEKKDDFVRGELLENQKQSVLKNCSQKITSSIKEFYNKNTTAVNSASTALLAGGVSLAAMLVGGAGVTGLNMSYAALGAMLGGVVGLADEIGPQSIAPTLISTVIGGVIGGVALGPWLSSPYAVNAANIGLGTWIGATTLGNVALACSTKNS
jgi:FtsH-binding integral membrane protein